MIRFVVYGRPRPAGSKRAFIPKGWHRPVVTDANPKSTEWKSQVKSEAALAMSGAPLLRGPLRFSATFFRPRPKCHFGSGRNSSVLKPSAPPWPTGAPDVLKLARGCEDSCSGIIYKDDAQICIEHLRKAWGEPARVEIEIEELIGAHPAAQDGRLFA